MAVSAAERAPRVDEMVEALDTDLNTCHYLKHLFKNLKIDFKFWTEKSKFVLLHVCVCTLYF